jgi:ribosomal protein S18 acetylase RimI-like enzyme
VDELIFRRACREDVSRIVKLLADDQLGASRERLTDPLPASYLDAFAEIDGDLNQELIVVEIDGAVVGCLQLTIIPGLSHQGAKRAHIEAVRIDTALRRKGVGERLIRHAIERAREHGCRLVQLTTNRSRVDAHRFYNRLGFVSTHLGYKLALE